MTPSNDLFDLIKSLNRSEKAYIKKYAGLYSSHNYPAHIQLFDAIDSLTNYDEEKVKKKLSGNQMLIARLSKEKNYLFSFILKALRSYYAGQSATNTLLNKLSELEILRKKGLYQLEHKHTLKIIQLAEENQFYLVQMMALEQTNRLKTAGIRLEKKTEDFLSTNTNKIIELAEIYLEKQQYRRLANELMFIDYKEGYILINEEIRKTVDSIAAALPHESPDNLRSFDAIRDWYIIKSYQAAMHGNLEICYNYRKAIMLEVEKRRTPAIKHLANYVAAISNLVVFAVRLEKWEECRKLIAKLRTLITEAEGDSLMFCKVHELIYNHELNLAIRENNPSGVTHLLPEIFDFHKEYQDRMSELQRTVLYFNLARLYFSLEQYGDAIPWINKIINGPAQVMINIQSIARILSIIAHYELGNFNILESLSRSAIRFLRERQNLFPVERLIFQFISNKSIYLSNHKTTKDAFTRLLEEIQELKKAGHDQGLPDYFDFMLWLEKKVKK